MRLVQAIAVPPPPEYFGSAVGDSTDVEPTDKERQLYAGFLKERTNKMHFLKAFKMFRTQMPNQSFLHDTLFKWNEVSQSIV